MTSIFLFSLILGGGLLALSLVGDLVGGGDAGGDPDLDLDLDMGDAGEVTHLGDAATATDTGLDGIGDAFRLFTIRNLTYFLFGFGAIGWLLMMLSPGLPILVITAAALVGGALSAGAAMAIFGWVRATDSGWQADEESFVGCEGRVTLPLGHEKVGRIMVRRGQREHELRALPFRTGSGDPGEWRNVVVIEMSGGTARVSPMEALAPAEGGRRTT